MNDYDILFNAPNPNGRKQLIVEHLVQFTLPTSYWSKHHPKHYQWEWK